MSNMGRKLFNSRVLAVGLLVAIWDSALPADPPAAQEIVMQALRLSTELAGARHKVEEAKGKVAEMMAQRRWQVDLTGTVSGSSGQVAEPAQMQSFATAEASLNFLLPNLAKAGALVDQAVADLTVAQAQLRRAELDVAFKARQAYIELWRARDAEGIAEENLAQATRQMDDTKKRIDAGDVPEADLLKTQVPVAQSKAALTRTRNVVRAAEQTLNNLLHRNLDARLDLAPAGVLAAVPIDAGAQVNDALLHSPDAIEAKAALASAKAGLRSARHNLDPSLSLQAGYTQTGDPTAYANLSSVGFSVSVPLDDGGAAAAQRRQAAAQVAEAQSALDGALRQIRLDVQQAILDVEGDEAALEAAKATEDVAMRSVEKARQSYAAGLTTTRDVLDSQLEYAQAKVDLASARYDLAISRAHLRQLTGGDTP